MPPLPPTRTLALRTLGMAECRLRQRAARGLSWSTPLPAWRRIAVRLHDLPPRDAGDRAAPLRIDLADGWLEFDDASLVELASGVPLGDWADAAHATAALRLATARVDDGVRSALGGLGQPRWPAARIDEGDRQALAGLQLTLVPADAQERYSFAARAPVDTALKWLLDPRWQPEGVPAGIDLERLPVTCEVQLGRARLRVAQLRALRRGDAILRQWPSPDARCQAWLRLGARALPLQAVPGGWRVQRLEGGEWWMEMLDDDVPEADFSDHPDPDVPDEAHMDDSHMDDSNLDGEPVGEVPVDEVQVTVTFVAARLGLALGQLRTLVPGSVIPTDQAADASVRILANGVEIGCGELVDVGGRLAVEITRLRSPSS